MAAAFAGPVESPSPRAHERDHTLRVLRILNPFKGTEFQCIADGGRGKIRKRAAFTKQQRLNCNATSISFLNQPGTFNGKQSAAGQRTALDSLADVRKKGVVLAYGDRVQG